jgi:hypothetical protein
LIQGLKNSFRTHLEFAVSKRHKRVSHASKHSQQQHKNGSRNCRERGEIMVMISQRIENVVNAEAQQLFTSMFKKTPNEVKQLQVFDYNNGQEQAHVNIVVANLRWKITRNRDSRREDEPYKIGPQIFCFQTSLSFEKPT